MVTPSEDNIKFVHNVINDELCLGVINQNSKKQFQKIIETLKEGGAQAIILGCTELMLLVKPEDSSLQLFNTTKIHAETAVDLAL